MTKVFSSYVNQKQGSEPTPKQPDLKFAYIWQNLDNLFQQMSQEDVNELNLNFVTQAIERIKKKK